MVTGAAVWALACLLQPVPAPDAGEAPRQAEFRKALDDRHYPWYDPSADALRPVEPPWTPSWWDRLPDWKFKGAKLPSLGFGQSLVFAIMVLALAALIAGLAYTLRTYLPATEPSERGGTTAGAARVGDLPAGLDRIDLSDPLGAARRLRERGDLSGAILALFVHQLLTLDRVRLIRLLPGRTARQLVRSVGDAWVRGRVEPTMRLFEASYYGHRSPPRAAFDAAWTGAEELDRRIAEGTFAP